MKGQYAQNIFHNFITTNNFSKRYQFIDNWCDPSMHITVQLDKVLTYEEETVAILDR